MLIHDGKRDYQKICMINKERFGKVIIDIYSKSKFNYL